MAKSVWLKLQHLLCLCRRIHLRRCYACFSVRYATNCEGSSRGDCLSYCTSVLHVVCSMPTAINICLQLHQKLQRMIRQYGVMQACFHKQLRLRRLCTMLQLAGVLMQSTERAPFKRHTAAVDMIHCNLHPLLQTSECCKAR